METGSSVAKPPRAPKFKLDENLDVHAADILRQAGYEAHTVAEEGLSGAADEDIAELCRREGRCLVTLDLHFADVLAYPPGEHAGILVLRHPRLRLRAVLRLVGQLVRALQTYDPSGQLWIVEPGRVRTHSGPAG